MSCGKCGKKAKLCPISFGLALGITSALAVIIWLAFMGMPHGMMPMMPANGAAGAAAPIMVHPSWGDISMHALWVLIKGFIFGFVLALIYDGFVCIGKHCTCCNKMGCSCCDSKSGKGCSCNCHTVQK